MPMLELRLYAMSVQISHHQGDVAQWLAHLIPVPSLECPEGCPFDSGRPQIVYFSSFLWQSP